MSLARFYTMAAMVGPKPGPLQFSLPKFIPHKTCSFRHFSFHTRPLALGYVLLIVHRMSEDLESSDSTRHLVSAGGEGTLVQLL